MAHTVQIQELINGIQITETVDAEVVVKLLSYQGKPFFRTTNETDEETYQIIDKVGEIYNLPALATEFVLIDLNDNVYIPANGEELIEYSVKLKPFRGDTEPDEAHTGIIETTANSVTINLPGDGVNWAKIDGSFYERYYPDTFNFTPVTTNQKILIVYAVPDELPFRLAQGSESAEAIEPDYNGLFIARIIVNTVGEVVEEEDNGFKVRSEDSWRTINNSTAAFIALGNNLAGSFHLTGSSDVQGFITKQGKFLWSGREFVIKTDQAVTLKASTFTDTSNAKHWTFAEDYDLPAESWAIIKEKAGVLEVVELGGREQGDYIPLTGTEEGKPVTGPISFYSEANEFNYTVRSFDDFTIYSEDNFGFGMNTFSITFRFESGAMGLTGTAYYGENYDDFTYIQKKYADLQHSYATDETKTGGTWIDGKPIYTITQLTADAIPADMETRFPDEIIGDYTFYKYTKTTDPTP